MSAKKTKQDVEAMIYNMSAGILLGKTTDKEIEKITELAKEYDLLPLIKQEFGDIHRVLKRV